LAELDRWVFGIHINHINKTWQYKNIRWGACMIQPGHGTVTSGPAGTILFTLTPTNTNISAGTYYFDVQINDGATTVYTVAYGSFIVV
jgi:hypothetical protein